MKKKILLLTTGGTIASHNTEKGLVPLLEAEDLMKYLPSVRQKCDLEALNLFSLDSTNMTYKEWLAIAAAIEENYDRYDGFVICHGTDTLAYTAAALSYMIQNSPKPIVVTGAQKPINMDVTDAKTNLLDSFIYAADDDSEDVSIVFDGKVIIGTRAKKERAKSYNAFSSINFPYPAVIQDGQVIRYIPPVRHKGEVRFYHDMKDSVYVLKLVPGMRSGVLTQILEQYDCVVIESFGVGGLPDSITAEVYEGMKKWKKEGKLIVMTTQVVSEGSNMTVYEVGKKVKQDFDLLEAYDMTLEATITKLMWLMAQPAKDYEEIKKRFYRMINHDILFAGFREDK